MTLKLFNFHFRIILSLLFILVAAAPAFPLDNPGITSESPAPGYFPLIQNINGSVTPPVIIIDGKDLPGIGIAADNLAEDFKRVCDVRASIVKSDGAEFSSRVSSPVIAGSIESPLIKSLVAKGKLNGADLKGKLEKYVMTTVDAPLPGVDRALVIAGSDRRGTIYGIYELSELIGVSPWYFWADVPPLKHRQLYIAEGSYTAGEPAVRYRGIFLNDEGPCLMDWVKNTYGTNYGDHRFYARVFELILRLRGNFLWPAMWAWAFYADDPQNSPLADETGVIIGTSHHEPMARNHQEWARRRKEYGAWNYASNQKVIDNFFTEGIRRAKNTEDVITIGMRGDGDEAMSEKADVELLKKVIANQRRIIEKETGKRADKTPQVWALYKEVLDYYDAGLNPPDDVIMLLCDDNWGNVRRLPVGKERKHPGGWGMYYHVDYVGAPRNSKLLNCTPIQNMWEQLLLTYQYGVDKLWVLNVGDLKPMEYPITLFLDMAWNPEAFTKDNLLGHTLRFFQQQLGPDQAPEAARIFNLLCKYNGRVTPEMLDLNTYNLATGEWKSVADDYARLEAEALRQYLTLEPRYKDAYFELLLFPLQLMSNLYEMYYAQAMNRDLHARNMPEADFWADKVKSCFERDALLMNQYNKILADGKWDGMMTQKHIGYTIWNDDFPADTLPPTFSISDAYDGGFSFTPSEGFVAMEAPHFFAARNPDTEAEWTFLPYVGRTLGGMAVMPYDVQPEGASISYRFQLPETVDSVAVRVVTKSTLAFQRRDGHRYNVALDGAQPVTVNFNKNLNEDPENIYSVFYPTVARRVVETVTELPVTGKGDLHTLEISPLDPGIVIEKIVVDFGGYQPSYLFGKESEAKR